MREQFQQLRVGLDHAREQFQQLRCWLRLCEGAVPTVEMVT